MSHQSLFSSRHAGGRRLLAAGTAALAGIGLAGALTAGPALADGDSQWPGVTSTNTLTLQFTGPGGAALNLGTAAADETPAIRIVASARYSTTATGQASATEYWEYAHFSCPVVSGAATCQVTYPVATLTRLELETEITGVTDPAYYTGDIDPTTWQVSSNGTYHDFANLSATDLAALAGSTHQVAFTYRTAVTGTAAFDGAPNADQSGDINDVTLYDGSEGAVAEPDGDFWWDYPDRSEGVVATTADGSSSSLLSRLSTGRTQLQGGQYEIGFNRRSSDSSYAPAYYTASGQAATAFNQATPTALNDAAINQLSAGVKFTKCATVTGTVTGLPTTAAVDPLGNYDQEIQVAVYDATDQTVTGRYAYSDYSVRHNVATGTLPNGQFAYTISGLTPGNYDVRVTYDQSSAWTQRHEARFLDGGPYVPATVRPLTVGACGTTTKAPAVDMGIATTAGSSASSAPGAATAGPNALAATAGPVITGAPTVGNTLTVSAGTWNKAGAQLAYQWYRDAQAIPSATAATYTVTTADIGHTLSAKVTASGTGLTAGTAAAPATAQVAKVKPSVTLKVLHKTIKPGAKPKVRLTVKATGLTRPTGVVKIKVNGKNKKTVLLHSSAKGKATVAVVRLWKARTYKVTASYRPSGATKALVTTGSAKSVKVKVKK
ncbi:MAG: hypothetical protein LBM66_03610 [Bifidobacteriaceae bacterium]|jgi:hypothetical protein|nr:hypothetical protein [Bifidobacteriaceae bacterium]